MIGYKRKGICTRRGAESRLDKKKEIGGKEGNMT